ncbi:MAG: hypothetical protein AB7L76_10160 [Burkholderiaceae bacterium]
MIHIESGVYVRVQELDPGPMPRPLQSGFSERNAYRVLGIYSASESAECYLILSNDRDELWFVSNRHFRIVGLCRSLAEPVVPIQTALAARGGPTAEAAGHAAAGDRNAPPLSPSIHFNYGSSSYV